MRSRVPTLRAHGLMVAMPWHACADLRRALAGWRHARRAHGRRRPSPTRPCAATPTGVRTLLAQGADVNAAQGDGMTALHWAALNGDLEDDGRAARRAGAGPKLVTRVGAYTPLHLASSRGHAAAVARLLDAGSKRGRVTATGVQPLHLAAQAGNVEAVKALLDRGADVNARDTTHGRTPLVFATSKNRRRRDEGAAREGRRRHGRRRTVIDYRQRSAADTSDAAGARPRDRGRDRPQPSATQPAISTIRRRRGAGAAGRAARRPPGGGRGGGAGAGADARAACDRTIRTPCRGGARRRARPSDIEQIGKQGGFTALHYAVRDGFADAGDAARSTPAATSTRRTAGDRSTPMVVAVINGQYDLAIDAARARRQSESARTTTAWRRCSRRSTTSGRCARGIRSRPPARSRRRRISRCSRRCSRPAPIRTRGRSSHIWYASYNTGRMGVDFTGATPFWRAAYALDVDAMRLLVQYGADPNIPTMTFGAPKRPNDPSGLPAVPAGRTARAAVPRGERRGLRHVTRRAAASPRARRLDAGGEVLHRGAGRRRQRPRRRRLHGAASRRRARRQRDDHVSRQAAAPTSWPSTARARRPSTWPTAPSSARSRSPRRSSCSRAWARRTITIAARASSPPSLNTRCARSCGATGPPVLGSR